MEMGHISNEEYHYLIDELAERHFFGDLILYFQDGNIQSNRLAELNSKSEIRDKMQYRKHRRVIKVHSTRPAGRPSNG